MKKRDLEEIALEEVYQKILKFYEGNDLEGAKREILKVIKQFPHSEEPYLLLGDVEFDMFSLEEALLAYKKAISINDNNPSAHSSIGRVYYLLSKFPEAERHIHRALDLNPEEAEALYLKGLLLDRERNFSLADQYLKKANLLEPDAYPQPVSLERERFEVLMYMEYNNIDLKVREFIGNVLLIVEDIPSDNDLNLLISPLAQSMLRIIKNENKKDFEIVFFKRNIEHFSEDEDDVRENIHICLLKEVNKILSELEVSSYENE